MDDCRQSGSHTCDGNIGERRSEIRETSILRLALIDCAGSTQLCRITNISLHGLQATVFGSVTAGSNVCIRVPDDITLEGTIVWQRDRSVGVKFGEPLEHLALLRFSGDPKARARRRRLPRLKVSAPASLRSGARSYAAELVDISPSGAMLRMADPLPSLGPIVLDAFGLPSIAGQIRWLDELRAGILFNAPMPLDILTHWLHRLYADEETSETFQGTDLKLA